MNVVKQWVWMGVLALAGCSSQPASTPPTVSEVPQPEKVLRGGGIYADDLGPETLDVTGYPDAAKKGYTILVDKCAVCHSAARPLNAPFVELSVSDIAALKQRQPEVFKDERIWRIDTAVWHRYTKRMAMKSRAEVTKAEAEAVWTFLIYDGKHRKLGKAATAWRAHREKLLEQFKARFPDTYVHLYGGRLHD